MQGTGLVHGLGPARDLELLVEPCHVGLDGVRRDEEPLPDLGVGAALREKAEDLHERGRMYIKLKSYDLAVKDFRQALSLDSDYKRAHWGMGNALFKQGKLKEALKAYVQYEKSGEKMAEGLRARIESLRRELRSR